jgi:hypothetical protein
VTEGAPRAAAPPPPPRTEPEAALPATTVVKAVVTGRLRDPRTLAGLGVAIALAGFLLGRRSAR